MIPGPVRRWLQEHDCGKVTESRPVSGGCINNGTVFNTTSGQSFFLKVNTHAPGDMFVREAEGLEALRVEDGPRVPEVYHYGPQFLLLEDLGPARQAPGYWNKFGRQLAGLHGHTGHKFGFAQDNYIGSTPQPNPWTEDGWEFFGRHRLIYQAELASRRGLLNREQRRQIEDLSNRLPKLVPVQPPSLIHGDLWSGNATTDVRGEPAIIDPAAHYGWAEAELAMTTLFGSFPVEFYRAYEEIRPLEPGYRERFPLYNLYHLLNHLNLFGVGYLGQVLSILNKYGS